MEASEISKKSSKINAPKVSMGVAFSLAVLKATVGFMTGSLSILSSAVDSILDTVASFFNFIAIKKAEEPADTAHQFGHGKYESLAAFIQSIIILATGLFILVSAWHKFNSNEVPEVGFAGIGVMILSIVATVFLTVFLRHVAKKEKSAVLEADAMHYAVDLYSNIGILLALMVMKYTGLTFIDPLVAAVVAIYIIYSALKLNFKVAKELLDERVEEDTYKKLLEVLNSFDSFHKDFHRLRTRSSGHEKFIDMHLTLCRNLTLAETHRMTDEIEEAIKIAIPDADITIHPEPCEHTDCDDKKDCNSYRVRMGLENLSKKKTVGV